MEERDAEGIWAIVGDGVTRFVGQITETSMGLRPDRATVLDSKWLKLFPAYEFICPIMPTPQGIQRMPAVVPSGACLEQMAVYIRWTTVTLFEDISKTDRDIYNDMVRKTVEHTKSQRLQRAGLAAPGALPTDRRGGRA